VQPPPAHRGMLHCRKQNWMLEEIPILDQKINARDVHVHDATRPMLRWPTSLFPICPQAARRKARLNEATALPQQL